MIKTANAFIVGILFAAGLGISGLSDTNKVIGFLDLFGNWNPSLIFVMVGAIASHMIFYRLSTKREAPLLDKKFHVPNRRDIDLKLLTGAFIFGAGWGLSGICPGPAVAGLGTGDERFVLFTGFMVMGMFVARQVNKSWAAVSDSLANKKAAKAKLHSTGTQSPSLEAQ